jgi:nucleoside-diphosphate-sugar epimerase
MARDIADCQFDLTGEPLRCLVTGCAGFIGSALSERLLAAGYSVVRYDNFRLDIGQAK